MTNATVPSCVSAWLSMESYSLLILLLSAFLFSVMGCFVKLSGETGIPSTELVLSRAIFQGTFVVVAMSFWKADTIEQGGAKGVKVEQPLLLTPFGGLPNVVKVVLARGIIGGMGFLLYYYAMTAIPLGDAVTLFSLYPIYTVILAKFMLNEQIRGLHVFATLASALGAIIIAGPSIFQHRVGGDHSLKHYLGYITAIIGSFCSALVIILVRKAGKVGAHTLQLLFSWCVFGIIFSVIFGFAVPNFDSPWIIFPSKKSWLYVLGLCSFGSIAHLFLNYAGRIAPAGLGSIMRASDIMWAYMWQVLVFHETPSSSTIFGVLLISTSIAVIAAQKVLDNNFVTKPLLQEEIVPIIETEGKDRCTSYGTTIDIDSITMESQKS